MFDKEEKQLFIKKMKPYADKLVQHFEKDGWTFAPTDGELNNVVFSKGDKQVKISHHSFYRFSGLAQIVSSSGNSNEAQATVVTDEMWFNNYMKPIVQTLMDNA